MCAKCTKAPYGQEKPQEGEEKPQEGEEMAVEEELKGTSETEEEKAS